MQTLLVDTNILQYGVKKDYAAAVGLVLQRLILSDHEPILSAYTTFEIYRGLAKEKIAAVKQLIDWFADPIEVDLQTFKIAAALTTCYKAHEATKFYADRYSDGDVILAASAIRAGAHVLTANGNDFPRPFFREHKNMTIKSNARPLSVTLQILVPDIRCFNDVVKECYR